MPLAELKYAHAFNATDGIIEKKKIWIFYNSPHKYPKKGKRFNALRKS